MKRDFRVYVVLTIIGLLLRAASDFNTAYSLQWNGDYLWGVGLAMILLGCAIYINKVTLAGSRKMFTRFFLFTAISNICDEALFNPYVVSWEEWAVAFGVYTGLFLYNKYELVRRNRN